MALRIRMARGGAKKRPYYRIVIADSRSPRDGRFIEKVGTYNPLLKKDDPTRVTLNEERIKYWLGHGATPSDRVGRFLGAANIIPMPAQRNNPIKGKPGAKAVERVKEAEEAAAAKKAEAEEAAKAAAARARAGGGARSCRLGGSARKRDCRAGGSARKRSCRAGGSASAGGRNRL